MRINRHLVIMARAPRLGRVKSRLAKDIGLVRAWSFYRHTLAQISRPVARDRRWTTWLFVSPDTSVMNDRVWPIDAVRIGQGTGDLGRRMNRIMHLLSPGPLVLIGADIPDVRPHHIWDAFTALGSHDVVFGPAPDGGYWLVGQRRRPRVLPLFENVRWSSSNALADTLENLPAGTQAGFIEELSDVDDGADYLARRAPYR